MRPNLRAGLMAAATIGGSLLAGCTANGGPQLGGGGGGSGAAACEFPFGPGSFVSASTWNGCQNCSVVNPENVIDTDPNTFATMNVTSVGSGIAAIYVKSGVVFPAGGIPGYVLEFPGLLEATVLPQFEIVTKLNETIQEVFQFNGVLGADIASLVTGGKFFLGEVTSKEYDGVEFGITVNGVNLLNQVNVHAACGSSSAATNLPFILVPPGG